jgi:cytosolic 5'-nucleotidase 3
MHSKDNNLSYDIESLFSEGPDKVHVLADFDGTLTKEYVGGKKLPSIVSVLREHPGYLSPEYQAAAKALSAHYKPLETDASLTLAERKSKMKEWWTKHNRLLIESGLTHDHLAQVANSGIIEFREGAATFLKLADELGIPVVVMSASGLGESIPLFCQRHKVDFDHLHFIINRFKWDKDGKAVGHTEPVIYVLNKDETVLPDFKDAYRDIQHRPNVLLLGNSPGDLDMAKGLKTQKLVTIGFLDAEEAERKPEFEKLFQHVVVGGYDEINRILKKII